MQQFGTQYKFIETQVCWSSLIDAVLETYQAGFIFFTTFPDIRTIVFCFEPDIQIDLH